MVRNSLQKAVLVDFLLAWNQFRTNNNAVFCGTAVLKYIKYVEQMHSEIPENYHEAILIYLHDSHNKKFHGFDETMTFSTEELDYHIDSYMNLKVA